MLIVVGSVLQYHVSKIENEVHDGGYQEKRQVFFRNACIYSGPEITRGTGSVCEKKYMAGKFELYTITYMKLALDISKFFKKCGFKDRVKNQEFP